MARYHFELLLLFPLTVCNKVNMPHLKKRALDNIKGQLKPNNIFLELFSQFTSLFAISFAVFLSSYIIVMIQYSKLRLSTPSDTGLNANLI